MHNIIVNCQGLPVDLVLREVDHTLLCLQVQCGGSSAVAHFVCVFSLRASHISFFGSGEYDVKVCTFQCLV